MSKQKIKWKDKIEEAAKVFSRKMQDAFREGLGSTQGDIPKLYLNEQEDKMNHLFHLNTFIDYLSGTTVSIVTQYVSDDEDFEKLYLEAVQEKFKQIREMRKRGILS